jgi:DNA-binding LacI/PurR family transcriptional regulator
MTHAIAELPLTAGHENKSERVYRALRAQIFDGTYPVNARLPSARDLSRDMAVSQVTALRGVKALADEGLVVSYPDRRGTVVVSRERVAPPRATTLACLLRPHLAKRPDDNFGLEIVQGMREAISEAGYRFIYHGLDERNYGARMLEVAHSADIPGLLLDQKTPDSVARELASAGVPAVMFNRRLDLPNLSCVYPDYEGAARRSVNLLLERGYERLGYYALQSDRDTWDEVTQAGEATMDLVWHGFAAAVRGRNIDLSAVHMVTEPSLPISAITDPAFFGLPTRRPADWKPLGMVVNFGRRALWLLEAIRQTDLVLGRDIGVITLIDLQVCREAPQPPSIWRVDRKGVGAAAVQELIARVEDVSTPASMTKIPMQFTDRQTF